MTTRLKEGVEVSIDATTIGYDEKNGEYEIEITNATLLCLDLKSKLLRIKVHSNKIKSLHDDDDTKTSDHNSLQHILEHSDGEPSDETDQEQEEDSVHNTNKEQFTPQQHHDDHFIPKDQEEIIEMSDHDDEDAKTDGEKDLHDANNEINTVHKPQTVSIQNNINKDNLNITQQQESKGNEHEIDSIKEKEDTMRISITTVPITVRKADTDEYASDDDNDRFQDDQNDNERSIKIEHNLRDPYLDEILTKQINAALQIEAEQENEHNIAPVIKQNKNDWRWALKAENVAIEWRKHAPTINLQNLSNITKSLKSITAGTISYVVGSKYQGCSLDIMECSCVQRLIFIMKYYSFWMKCKTETMNCSEYKEYGGSISDFIDSLKAYNRSKLLGDYLHIRHYHFNDDKLIAYIHRSQIPDCNDSHKMCKCITRNDFNKEMYKNMNSAERRALYWINFVKEESLEEIKEINLQKLLDVIHSSFLHNAISNGMKFVTSVVLRSKPMIYEFGMKLKYSSPKYPDLKTELLNNPIHKLSAIDFMSIYICSTSYIACDEGAKNMMSKRSMFGIVCGSKISIEHVVVILTRCNYAEIERKFNMNNWMNCDKSREIANWSKLLVETIMCFGDILDDSQYIYHGINYSITFGDICGIQFNIPISCTTQYSVARNFANEYKDGICLKLGKMHLTRDINYMFSISDFSDYPNEREVIVFGDKLSFVDIVYDSLSHHDYVLSLQLYQSIIGGRFFTTTNDYHNKKHQRRIVKMIENMINNDNNNNDDDMVKIDLDLGLNYIDPYIQSLFETITKNVLKNTIWINKESDTLLPELKTIFINDFIPFLAKKPFNIQSKYAHVDTWIITKKHLLMTNRLNTLKSMPFDHVQILNNDEMDTTDDDDNKITVSNNNKEAMSLKQFKSQISREPTDLKITFGFRCYKKYDPIKKEDMFKGEFMIMDFPPQIDSVKMLGGLWFPQIPLCKWDWCSFSNKKKSKGSSLFPINQITDDDELKIKICYQVKEVIQKVSLP